MTRTLKMLLVIGSIQVVLSIFGFLSIWGALVYLPGIMSDWDHLAWAIRLAGALVGVGGLGLVYLLVAGIIFLTSRLIPRKTLHTAHE
jgi:hypothetical protein